MARLWKIAPAFLIALVLALAVACGGGDSDKATKNTDDGAGSDGLGSPSEPIVASAAEVFGPSVKAFQEQVQSVRAEIEMDMSFGEFAISASGEMAFRQPEDVYMLFEVDSDSAEFDLGELGKFEMLAEDGKFYINIPFLGGWFVADPSEFEGEFEGFGGSLEDQWLVDYAALVNAFGDQVEDFGEESLDGGTFRHFRVSIDVIDLMESFSDSFDDSGEFDFADVPLDSLAFPIVMDVWVHPDSMLPHLIEADAGIEYEGESMEIDMSMSFFDYNEDFDLPDPPADARPFEEMFGGFFGDLEDAFEVEEAQ